jgi:hypothetical protein
MTSKPSPQIFTFFNKNFLPIMAVALLNLMNAVFEVLSIAMLLPLGVVLLESEFDRESNIFARLTVELGLELGVLGF